MDPNAHLRTCIVSREAMPEERLIRFVAAPDGTIVPDLKHRLPGRGAWVEAKFAAIAAAQRKNLFARALKAPVQASADLAGRIENLLVARVLDQFGMAFGQGRVVVGATKVDNAARSGRLKLVFFAKDGASDSRRKLVKALSANADLAPWLYEGFTIEQMSLALGRANVVHAGVATGRSAATLLAGLRRLDDYVGTGPSLTSAGQALVVGVER
ncbi:MAG: RNA-binding protein [Alphaproteobacteria bacterium]